MPISGQSIIGGSQSNSQGAVFQAFDPVHGKQIGPDFHSAEPQDVERACVLAQAAFDIYRETGQETRARFLETIAQQILDIGDELILRAMAESGLPRARLEGERGRTVGQLRLFAAVLREGSWNDARIDPALPERLPQPRVDLQIGRAHV